MKKFIASVTLDGELMIIEREGYTKKAFYNDLRCNGFRVRFISTEEKFDEDCEKYNEACERNKAIKKSMYAMHKEDAKRMGMKNAREYEEWLKDIR